MRYILLLLLIFCSSATFATWSIIIIDPKTGEIGIAGASCSPNCYGIGTIVPNVGAVIVQAMSNNDARKLGVQMIISNSAPEEIIGAMRNPDFDPANQQYAIVTLRYLDHPATYTGDSTHRFNGALTSSGVSVQGNTLANENELQIILDAVLKSKKENLHIADILMIALEAGSKAGGDKRCGEQKSTSAFIIVAKPDDKRPYLDLSIFGQWKGGPNATDLLKKKFDKWKNKNE